MQMREPFVTQADERRAARDLGTSRVKVITVGIVVLVLTAIPPYQPHGLPNFLTDAVMTATGLPITPVWVGAQAVLGIFLVWAGLKAKAAAVRELSGLLNAVVISLVFFSAAYLARSVGAPAFVVRDLTILAIASFVAMMAANATR